MEVLLRVDIEKDKEQDLHNIISTLYNKSTSEGQQKLNQSSEKKYYCNNPQCKAEITKDVVAFCLHEDNKPRFKGKVYCRDCQSKFGGGST